MYTCHFYCVISISPIKCFICVSPNDILTNISFYRVYIAGEGDKSINSRLAESLYVVDFVGGSANDDEAFDIYIYSFWKGNAPQNNQSHNAVLYFYFVV